MALPVQSIPKQLLIAPQCYIHLFFLVQKKTFILNRVDSTWGFLKAKVEGLGLTQTGRWKLLVLDHQQVTWHAAATTDWISAPLNKTSALQEYIFVGASHVDVRSMYLPWVALKSHEISFLTIENCNQSKNASDVCIFLLLKSLNHRNSQHLICCVLIQHVKSGTGADRKLVAI